MMKKVFFKQRNLEIGECNGILSKSFPAGKDFSSNPVETKNEIMKFLGFSKIWRKFSLKIYFQEKKKILK